MSKRLKHLETSTIAFYHEGEEDMTPEQRVFNALYLILEIAKVDLECYSVITRVNKLASRIAFDIKLKRQVMLPMHVIDRHDNDNVGCKCGTVYVYLLGRNKTHFNALGPRTVTDYCLTYNDRTESVGTTNFGEYGWISHNDYKHYNREMTPTEFAKFKKDLVRFKQWPFN